MAKRRVSCPECGHKHTITIEGRPMTRASVRTNKLPNGKFELTMTAPQETIEAERIITVTDDLALTGAVGAGAGAVCGFSIAAIAPQYSLYAIAIGSSAGATLAWCWLCAEYHTRQRVFNWLASQRANWKQAGQADGGVTLTVDHRYRDGNTELGRSINYFGTLPVDLDRFNEWARSALRGDSLAFAHWQGSGKLFSRAEYDRLLTAMQKGEVVVNVSGKGNMLTAGGRRALVNHLKAHPPTPPKDGV